MLNEENHYSNDGLIVLATSKFCIYYNIKQPFE